MDGKRVYAYVDETGDRGASPKASPVFGMSAVIVEENAAQELQQAVLQLRSDFAVPIGTVLSWKEHVKNHDRRKRAAEVLRAVEGVTVCYVYAEKAALRAGTYRDDQQRFYNYVAGKIYKSILWAVRSEHGEDARVWTRFGHVRRHDHTTTKEYLENLVRDDPKVPDHLEQGLRWISADRYAESQAADLYGGFLKAAVWPSGEFSYVEPAYLLSAWHQIRASSQCAIPLGIMSMPDYRLLLERDWFPCDLCPKKEQPAEGLQGPIR